MYVCAYIYMCVYVSVCVCVCVCVCVSVCVKQLRKTSLLPHVCVCVGTLEHKLHYRVLPLDDCGWAFTLAISHLLPVELRVSSSLLQAVRPGIWRSQLYGKHISSA